MPCQEHSPQYTCTKRAAPTNEPISESRLNLPVHCGTVALMLGNELREGRVHCSRNINKHLPYCPTQGTDWSESESVIDFFYIRTNWRPDSCCTRIIIIWHNVTWDFSKFWKLWKWIMTGFNTFTYYLYGSVFRVEMRHFLYSTFEFKAKFSELVWETK